MDKATKVAVEKYPHGKFDGELGDSLRAACAIGYMRAEKDLALTLKDLELLHTFLCAVKNNKQGCFTFTRLSDEQYQEVIRRFNDQREKK